MVLWESLLNIFQLAPAPIFIVLGQDHNLCKKSNEFFMPKQQHKQQRRRQQDDNLAQINENSWASPVGCSSFDLAPTRPH